MKLTFAFFVILLTSFSVYAKPEKQCAPKNPDDPFAVVARMSAGIHKNECINTNRYRSSTRLTPEQMEQFLTANEQTQLSQMGLDIRDPSIEMMANFAGSDAKKQEHFYVAIVPVERVQNAVIELTRLSKIDPLILHGQIRLGLFATGRPVILIDQTVNPNREIKELKDDIVITISGVRPILHEEPYNPVKGLIPGYYGEEYQIGSFENLSTNWITPAKLKMKEYTLNVNTDQARAALKIGLNISTQSGITTPYSTLTSSCLNVAFLILHDVLGTSDKGDWRKLAQSLAPEPALMEVGLINADGSSYIRTLPEKKPHKKTRS